jgi:hypothetical protein
VQLEKRAKRTLVWKSPLNEVNIAVNEIFFVGILEKP